MIKYVQGDLFEASEDLIAHGCNCRNGFGSGVARQMSITYPKAKEFFHDKFEVDGWRLGEVQFVRLIDKKHQFVANCATQYAYLPRGVKHADYDAIRAAMTTVKEFAQAKSLSVAIPKIGAGLAGGKWEEIEKIISEVFSDYDITVYYQ